MLLKDPSGVLLKYVDEDESIFIITDMHKGYWYCGGHQLWKERTYKIMRDGYYWPTLFSDCFAKIRACEQCQKFVGKQKLQSLTLKPIVASGQFQQ